MLTFIFKVSAGQPEQDKFWDQQLIKTAVICLGSNRKNAHLNQFKPESNKEHLLAVELLVSQFLIKE
ncbi:hypothetical protein POKO110462_19665 [Pontibacter korlensis]|uniref:Uncharacterized protein n=1 Tax=Pontibacter korlensis TaxID=400092 RepID=A0A0E3UXD6_9BACT|nr:hypothetical protein PKOR_14980 [Pontibacter korlensis]